MTVIRLYSTIFDYMRISQLYHSGHGTEGNAIPLTAHIQLKRIQEVLKHAFDGWRLRLCAS